MKDIKSQIRKTFKKRKLDKLHIHSYIINIVSNYFDKKYEISWFVKNNILFLHINPIMAKTNIFLKRKQILKIINQKIQQFDEWYIIEDIIIK